MGVNTVIFVSLLLDLLAFTLILPLLPSTLECFSVSDESGFYKFIQSFIDSSQSLIGSPEKFNKALFGGLLGSWYSLLQFITMPMIGSLSDVYGRKVLYLVCLVGISLSYLLWNLSAGYFSVFVLFRTLGGLSKGNISLSTAIVTDVSTEKDRGKGFALIGIAFSLGFILGPLLGAWMTLGQFHSPESCFQSFPPLIALTLSLANLIFSYLYLPETLPISKRASSIGSGLKDAFNYINPWSLFSFKIIKNIHSSEKKMLQLGGYINFLFLFIYSGLEFTLTFLTYIRFNFTNIQQGKLYFYVGIVMFLIQGLFVRRINVKYYSSVLLSGIAAVVPSFLLVGFSSTVTVMSAGLVLYAYASATVVPTLSTLVSTFGPPDQKGTILGIFRSIGALARAIGPLTASFLFWKYGIETVYCIGGCAMLIPLYLTAKLNSVCSQKDTIDWIFDWRQ